MRMIKVLLSLLAVIGLVFLSVSCAGASSSPTPTPQIVTVKRGNIQVSVTGTGSLALEHKQELSFGQTGVASQATTAKISEVDVMAGQTVKQGQVLVKADTTDYQDQLITDQHNLDSALAAVAQAQNSVTQAQANIAQAQTSLIQDQAALVKAQQNLSAQQDVQNLQNQIDNANIQLQEAQLMLQQAEQASNNPEATAQYWQDQINYLSVDTKYNSKSSHTADGGEIGLLQKQMNDLLTDPAHAGATLVSSSAASVAQIQQDVLAVQLAQAKIVTDQANLASAQANVVIAQNNVILAQNKATDAQTTLTNDKNSAQEIDAPFDGLITQVNVTAGSIVQRNATLIEIAEPNKFVANILVTEHDVLSCKIGDKANVSLSAVTGYGFPAQITQIAPLATVQQGVVNYQVTVELSSTNPTSQTGGFQRPSASPSATPSAAAPTGNSAAATPSIVLKDGLSVVVTIPIQSRTDVLILPSRAITRQGQASTVQRINGTVLETVTVQTGLTDGTNTEIISGLSEGDRVQLKTTTTSTTSGFGGGPGGFRIP
jgi:HlyD family secretion protein